MLCISFVLYNLLFALPIQGSTVRDKSVCQSVTENNEEVNCPGASVYIANEGRCVDIRQFTCPTSSWKTVEYLADPYLCNVHHMCYQGVEVSRVCCSPGQIFSPELQACTDSPIGHVNNCESDPCALKYLDDVCSFSFEPRTGVTYPTEECPAATYLWSASLLHSSSESERYQPYNIPSWDARAVTPDCTDHVNTDAFCVSCSFAVLCLDFGGSLSSFNATCDSAGTACSIGSCKEVSPGDECACTSSSGLSYQPDPYTEASYITCIEGTAYYTDCPVGDVFDGVSQCVTPITTTTVATTTPTPCTTTGLSGIDCYQYSFCTAVDAPPIISTCPEGQFFDSTTGQCVEQVPPFQCETSGSFPDPYDCRRYYICSSTTLFAADCCSPGQYYDATSNGCASESEPCNSNFECKPNVTSVVML